MPILNVQPNQVGQSGVAPSIIFIFTNDTISEVTTIGYLNGVVQKFGIPLSESQLAAVTTKTSPNAKSTQVGWFSVIETNGNWGLTVPTSEGGVILPTIPNHIATYIDTNGTLSEDAATAINRGNIQAGLSGFPGYLASFPADPNRGSLRLTANDNAGNTVTQISNSSMAQSSTINIPDPGAASANFLLDTGTSSILQRQQFIGLDRLITIQTGVWTLTRFSQGIYGYVHTPAAETSIIAMDVAPIISTIVSKGCQITSFDVIYSIGTTAMNSHTVTLNEIAYFNNSPIISSPFSLLGSLQTNTQANPYVTNISVNFPEFLIQPASDYIIELSANNQITTDYTFYGINLHFSQTIS